MFRVLVQGEDVDVHQGRIQTVNFTIMNVTPVMAREWLAHQHSNRPVNRSLIRQLTRAIVEGRWQTTHQGLAFDDDGRLVDGQHRCTAIVEANVAVRISCAFGVSHDTATRAVDQGHRRSIAQQVGMRGEKDASTKAAVARAIGVATLDMQIGDRFDPTDFDLVMIEYRSEIERGIAALRLVPGFTSPAIAAAALALRVKAGEEFLSGCATGVGLGEGDPRLALRNALLRPCANKNAMADRFLRTISAAHAFARDVKLGSLMISARRYSEFCTDAKIRVCSSLMTYAENANGK